MPMISVYARIPRWSCIAGHASLFSKPHDCVLFVYNDIDSVLQEIFWVFLLVGSHLCRNHMVYVS